ncbi:MAG: RHS repeat-associated core domain-containing protein, partial [Planctomycetota bacterium]
MSIRPSTLAKYEYDGLNRRVKKHIDPVRTARTGVRRRSLWKNAESGILLRGAWARVSPKHNRGNRHFFYNGGWQVLETRVTDPAAEPPETENTAPQDLDPEYQYVWSARYIDAPILRDKNTDEDGLCDDERLYYTTDANMHVTALVLEDEEDVWIVVERYQYNAYGHTHVCYADWESNDDGTNYDNVILFAGYYRDPETHFYHVRNRPYHAELGRFLQRDPDEYVDGMNLYEYVRSNACNDVD